MALVDLLTTADEDVPKVGDRVLCRHSFQSAKRAYVKPALVESLLKLYWQDGKVGGREYFISITKVVVKK